MSDSDREERLQEMHNKGQEDGASGESCDTPYNTNIMSLFYGEEMIKEMEEENEAYEKGWDNGRANSG